MIELKDFILRKIDFDNIEHGSFFNNMNQDEKFQKYFGRLAPSKQNSTLFNNNYIIEEFGKKVGFVYLADKIERDDIKAVTLYYYVSKEHRGRKIATNVLKKIVNYLNIREHINYFILNISLQNGSSMQVALNNGFTESFRDEEEIQFTKKVL